MIILVGTVGVQSKKFTLSSRVVGIRGRKNCYLLCFCKPDSGVVEKPQLSCNFAFFGHVVNCGVIKEHDYGMGCASIVLFSD